VTLLASGADAAFGGCRLVGISLSIGGELEVLIVEPVIECSNSNTSR
jgi:hypothetical protein